MASDLPGAVLFACGQNIIRSAMAENLMRHFYGHKVYVQSCGARAGERDPFVTAVMDEMGIDMKKHHPKSFEDLDDTTFDLIVSMAPEAHHKAMELTRTMAVDVEYWPTLDPSVVSGSREQILDAYREVRDSILKRLRQRFGTFAARGV